MGSQAVKNHQQKQGHAGVSGAGLFGPTVFRQILLRRGTIWLSMLELPMNVGLHSFNFWTDRLGPWVRITTKTHTVPAKTFLILVLPPISTTKTGRIEWSPDLCTIGWSATEHVGQWPYLKFFPKVCLRPANPSDKGRGFQEEEAASPLEKHCTGTSDTRGSSFCSTQRSRSRSKAASTGSSTMGSSWKKSSSSSASVNACSKNANPDADIGCELWTCVKYVPKQPIP